MSWMSKTVMSIKALMVAIIAGQSNSALAQSISPDDRAWDAAVSAGTAEACQQYLSDYPTGTHAEEAFRCLVEGVVPASASNRQPVSADIY